MPAVGGFAFVKFQADFVQKIEFYISSISRSYGNNQVWRMQKSVIPDYEGIN